VSWRRWKLGLIAAAASTFLDGLIVSLSVPEIVQHLKEHWLGVLIGLVIIVAKAAAMWMRQHPIEEIQDATEILTKDDLK
jgi:hypothetical protein